MTLTAWILWGFLCGLVTGTVLGNPMGYRAGYQAGRQDGLTFFRAMLGACPPRPGEEVVH